MIWLISPFHHKAQKWLNGRKNIWQRLQEISKKNTQNLVWFHCASVGEFEQALPVIEKFTIQYPDYKIFVSFYSPSGYEYAQNKKIPYLFDYLPLDTAANAKKLVQILKPKLVFYIKYEFWFNLMRELTKNHIPMVCFSAYFTEKQVFFKNYARFLSKELNQFSHFFVQDEKSKILLQSININQVSVTGDTRFERVVAIFEENKKLDFIENFKGSSQLLILGSVWLDDMKVIAKTADLLSKEMKILIAPHEMSVSSIEKITNELSEKFMLWSDLEKNQIPNILILNTVGFLSQAFKYADYVYIGGGFKTGLHNILEPAVWGKPIVIGPEFDRYKEAEDLVKLKGVIPIQNAQEFGQIMDKLKTEVEFRQEKSSINQKYIMSKSGGAKTIVAHCKIYNL